MIPIKITTVSGTVREMRFDTKENVFQFIDNMSAALPQGVVVNIDAPLVGIHSGWIHGESQQ
jgi:hypothetical protein